MDMGELPDQPAPPEPEPVATIERVPGGTEAEDVSAEGAEEERELTQTDHINKKLLMSFMANFEATASKVMDNAEGEEDSQEEWK